MEPLTVQTTQPDMEIQKAAEQSHQHMPGPDQTSSASGSDQQQQEDSSSDEEKKPIPTSPDSDLESDQSIPASVHHNPPMKNRKHHYSKGYGGRNSQWNHNAVPYPKQIYAGYPPYAPYAYSPNGMMYGPIQYMPQRPYRGRRRGRRGRGRRGGHSRRRHRSHHSNNGHHNGHHSRAQEQSEQEEHVDQPEKQVVEQTGEHADGEEQQSESIKYCIPVTDNNSEEEGETSEKKDEKPVHSYPQMDVSQTMKTPCKFFSKGKCKYAFNCRFSHAHFPEEVFQIKKFSDPKKKKDRAMIAEQLQKLIIGYANHHEARKDLKDPAYKGYVRATTLKPKKSYDYYTKHIPITQMLTLLQPGKWQEVRQLCQGIQREQLMQQYPSITFLHPGINLRNEEGAADPKIVLQIGIANENQIEQIPKEIKGFPVVLFVFKPSFLYIAENPVTQQEGKKKKKKVTSPSNAGSKKNTGRKQNEKQNGKHQKKEVEEEPVQPSPYLSAILKAAASKPTPKQAAPTKQQNGKKAPAQKNGKK